MTDIVLCIYMVYLLILTRGRPRCVTIETICYIPSAVKFKEQLQSAIFNLCLIVIKNEL